jgi:hypothetical protein
VAPPPRSSSTGGPCRSRHGGAMYR